MRYPHVVPGETSHGRLRTASVQVTGNGRLPDLIAVLLTRSGVGTVSHLTTRAGSSAGATERASLDLIIEVLPAGHSQPAAMGAPASPLLPVRVGAQEIVAGPLLGMPGGRCRSCCVAAGPPEVGTGADPGGAAIGVAAGVAAGAVLRYLGGYGTTWAWNAAIGVALTDGQQRRWSVPRRPGCPACGRAGTWLRDSALSEFDRDQAAELPPRGGDTEPLAPRMRAAPGPSRRHLTGRRMNPRQPQAGLPARAEPDRAMWQLLSWVLERGVGTARIVRSSSSELPNRWSPSVGSLGPLQAYVIRDLPDEAGQAWFYDAAARDFVALPYRQRPGRGGPAATGKAALRLVLVGDREYCISKLGPSGARAVFQDAGAAVAQLSWSAQAAGWHATAHAGECPDQIMAGLEVDAAREVVTAVIDVEVPRQRSPASASSPRSSMQRASSVLGRSLMTYSFGPAPVPAALVDQAVRRALALTTEVWPQGGPEVGCVVYARRVTGLRPGCHDALTRPELTGPGAGLCPVVEAYLADRRLDPPALVLFHGDREATLADYGASGHAALITKCAATANFTRLLSTAAGLSSGLFARLPSALLDAAAERLRVGPQVYCGLAIGQGLDPAAGMGVTW